MPYPFTHEELLEILDYSPETGDLRWKKRISTRGLIGSVAGNCLIPNGYYKIQLMGRSYRTHRIIWFYVNGVEASGMIDHINGNPLDNRIENLRISTNSQNKMNSRMPKNNTSGVKGVLWVPSKQRWRTVAVKDGKTYYFGSFKQLEDAKEAIIKGRAELHGEFAKH